MAHSALSPLILYSVALWYYKTETIRNPEAFSFVLCAEKGRITGILPYMYCLLHTLPLIPKKIDPDARPIQQEIDYEQNTIEQGKIEYSFVGRF